MFGDVWYTLDLEVKLMRHPETVKRVLYKHVHIHKNVCESQAACRPCQPNMGPPNVAVRGLYKNTLVYTYKYCIQMFAWGYVRKSKIIPPMLEKCHECACINRVSTVNSMNVQNSRRKIIYTFNSLWFVEKAYDSCRVNLMKNVINGLYFFSNCPAILWICQARPCNN